VLGERLQPHALSSRTRGAAALAERLSSNAQRMRAFCRSGECWVRAFEDVASARGDAGERLRLAGRTVRYLPEL
jgi:hypothetical protein